MPYENIDGDYVHQAIEKIGFGKFQIFVIVSLGLRIFQRATARVLDTVLEPFLLCEMHLSVFDASWIVTAKAIGQIFGAMIIGRLSDLYGRKRVLMFLFMLETLAYSLNALSNGYTMIIATRTAIGLFAPSEVIAAAYIIEVLPANRRNMFTVLKVFHITGALFCMGTAMITLRYLNWRWFVAISNCLPLAVCAGLVFFIPESPRFLFKTRQHVKTLSVLKRMAKMNNKDGLFEDFVEECKLNGNGNRNTKEVIKTSDIIDENTRINSTGKGGKSCESEKSDETGVSRRTLFKRIFMISVFRGVVTILGFLGILGSLQFSDADLATAAKSKNSTKCTNNLKYQYVGYLQIGVAFSWPVAYLFIGKLTRVLSLKILFGLMILNIIPFYWQITGWPLIISLVTLTILTSVFTVVCYVYNVEVLPTSHRALGLGIAESVGNIGFLISSVIVDYLYHVSRPLSFGLYQGFTVIGLVTVFLFAFETKDTPLDQK